MANNRKRKKRTLTPPYPDGLELVRRVHTRSNTLHKPVWSPSGDMLAIPSKDGAILILDYKNGRLLRELVGNGEIVTSVAW